MTSRKNSLPPHVIKKSRIISIEFIIFGRVMFFLLAIPFFHVCKGKYFVDYSILLTRGLKNVRVILTTTITPKSFDFLFQLIFYPSFVFEEHLSFDLRR